MKKVKNLKLSLLALPGLIVLASCASALGGDKGNNIYYPIYENANIDNNTYTPIDEFDFIDTTTTDSSYISLNTSTASYLDLRNRINNNHTITKDMVKIEEMLNFFNYDYDLPTGQDVLSLNASVVNTPWNEQTHLMAVGMRAEELDLSQTVNNIVLLIDTSGSMYGSNKLGLVQNSFSMLIDNLKSSDRVSIVTYAGSDKVLVDGASGQDKLTLKNAIFNLSASGSTAGNSAIHKAYDVAEKYHQTGVKSTIIIATDGDFNVGVNDPKELRALISEKNALGISLSAVGVGFGNVRNDILESIAEAGNGRHIYLSDLDMGKKFFVEELGGILNIVAKDAKAEIKFNKEVVASFRIIGYENRIISQEDFEDEEKQAGAIGSGLQVTAVYEIKLKDVEVIDNFATINVAYKVDQQGKQQQLIIDDRHYNPEIFTATIIKNDDMLFIICVVELGLILRDSAFKGSANYNSIYQRLNNIVSLDDDPYRIDFLNLIIKLK